MPQNQGGLDAILLVEDKKENLISNLARSCIYEKLVTNVRLSAYITDTKIEYSHLHSTSSLLPHWDTITATSSTLITSPVRSQQQARTLASSSSSRIESLGGSSIKARFMKPGKYSHVTWLGGNKVKY